MYDLALAKMKTDLGRTDNVPPAVETRMLDRLAAAQARLAKMGIHLDESSADDTDLLVMYAVYLYEKRKSNEPMPRMLRDAINDYKVANATSEEAVW